MSQNVRRTTAEFYDPKQRFVGGVVLFLLMLLIYGTLKLVLGFSSVPEGEYKLSAPLLDEEFPVTETSIEETPDNNNSLAAVANNAPSPTSLSSSNTITQGITESYRLPGKFVFLNLNGKPMRPNLDEMVVYKPTATINSNIDPNVLFNKPIGENRWYVQIASFKSEAQAQNFITNRIKNRLNTPAYIVHRGSWYAVRLHPTTQDLAEQQEQQVRRKLRVKPIVRKIK